MILAEELAEIFPHAGKRIALYAEPLNDAMHEFEITSTYRIAAFLAQVGQESGELKYVTELASGDDYDDREDLGNREPEALAASGGKPGSFYKGRGLIQVTGYYNFRDCGAALGLDLVHSPHQLSLPVPACRSAGWYWESRGLNEIADLGTEESFRRITQKVNGAATEGAPSWHARRVQYWRRALAVLGA